MHLGLGIQLIASVFLAHGYDFRVSYVAGRNIVAGLSPYIGGEVSGWLAKGYGSHVQGIGETPLWALYLGLCYYLSGGEVFLFNFLTKLPIIGANVGLAHLAYARGLTGWRFYLLNIFLIATTVTWGKADNLATYLALLALIVVQSPIGAALLLSTSIMIKPLAVAIAPSFVSLLVTRPGRWGLQFVPAALILSGTFFTMPFIVLGWPLETVIGGLVNWLSPAGALSPFNILEALYGILAIPPSLWWAGYLAPLGMLLLAAYPFLRPPKDPLRFALLSAALFFTLRPWVSEQNLVIVLALFILLRGRLPSRWLWVVPFVFAIANDGVQQQFFLLMPNVVDNLDAFYGAYELVRLWLRFGLSLVWLGVLWFNVRAVLGHPHWGGPQ